MSINLDRVATISRDVASEFDQRLSVVSVLASEGGGTRAEMLVVVDGCHDEPCRHIVNVSRANSTEFEHQFRAKLLEALNVHRVE